MGPYAEGSRLSVSGLQAADMLAYAAFRHFSAAPSWLWDELQTPRRLSVSTYGEDYWATMEHTLAGRPESF